MNLLKIPYEHPIKIEWKLKKTELEVSSDSAKNGFTSDQYSVSKIAGIYYYFYILPFGDNDDPETKEKTWIYLDLTVGMVKEVETNFVISIESTNVSINVNQIFKATEGRGWFICESNEFFDPSKNYFVNDELIIKIDGTLKFDRPMISKLSYPISTKWTFKASNLEQLREEIYKYVESETFEIPSTSGIKYNLRIYPNVPNGENRGNVFLCLHFEFSNNIFVETNLTLTVNQGTVSIPFRNVFENGGVFGLKICSTEDLFNSKNGYFVNGEIIFTLEGHIFVGKKDPEFLLFFDGIESGTHENTQYSERNFVITVDGQEIQINKQLLANVSTVFAGMMKSGMKETIKNRLKIPDFPFKTVDSAIKLLYEISPTFTLEDMLPLLVFFDKYDIQLIKELIENHLIKELLPSNVCQLIHFSHLFNATKLYEKSVEFFLKCYKESIGVNDLDLIEKEMLHQIFVSAIPSISY